MDFTETLLAAIQNLKHQSSDNSLYYKSRFDPPKKEEAVKNKLSENIQKFLAKKEEEQKQKQLEAQKKRKELFAMRDSKTLKKIQKTLKVIKSANKSVIDDAVDRNNTAITLYGSEQPDQDDYGYVSQEASAFYEKLMEKYRKLSEESKLGTKSNAPVKVQASTKKKQKIDLHDARAGIIVPKKSGPRKDYDKEISQPKKHESVNVPDKKTGTPRVTKSIQHPMDFIQVLKLAEKKKSEPINITALKQCQPEPDRLMTKRQKIEHENEIARRKRRLEMESADLRRILKVKKPEKGINLEPSFYGRISKLRDEGTANQQYCHVPSGKGKEKAGEKSIRNKIKYERNKERIDAEKLEKLQALRKRIDRDIHNLERKETFEKTNLKLELKTDISDKFVVDKQKIFLDRKYENKNHADLMSQNTYRKYRTQPEKTSLKESNSDYIWQIKGPVSHRKLIFKRKLKQSVDNKLPKTQPKIHEDGYAQTKQPKHRPNDLKRGKRLILDSDSDNVSDVSNNDKEKKDYSAKINKLFGSDKSKYKDSDDDDDQITESSYAEQQREEYHSRKIAIMEDLEEMLREAKAMKKSKKKY